MAPYATTNIASRNFRIPKNGNNLPIDNIFGKYLSLPISKGLAHSALLEDKYLKRAYTEQEQESLVVPEPDIAEESLADPSYIPEKPSTSGTPKVNPVA